MLAHNNKDDMTNPTPTLGKDSPPSNTIDTYFPTSHATCWLGMMAWTSYYASIATATTTRPNDEG